MTVVGRVDNFAVILGGEPHSGWLPPGAAVPLPTPRREVTLHLTISFEGDGYLLIVESTDGSIRGDTWHQTLADAQQQALMWYGVPLSAWQTDEPGVE